MKNVVLIGFMGCGKTAVGHILSKKLKLQVLDTDKIIVRDEKKEIRDVFDQRGEDYFRECEKRAVQTAAASQGVIATGGGVPLYAENILALKESGIVYYLDTVFEILYGRIVGDVGRPLVLGNGKEELEALYEQRRTFYEQGCDYRIECGNSDANAIAEMIMKIHISSKQSFELI